MPDTLKLLLVDDDRALSMVLSEALREEGFQVVTAHDGKEGLRRFETEKPDLVVLDVLMPELDGLEVCRRIRARSQVPVMLLTSRAEEVDKVMGLDLGADDYVTKPFSTRELCARLRALGRRARPALPSGGTATPPSAGASLRISREKFEVRWRDAVIPLTKSEFLVVEALAQRPGVVLGRDRLIDVARGEDVVVTERTVDSYVKRIRKKFRDADESFDALETVIGVGYRWREA